MIRGLPWRQVPCAKNELSYISPYQTSGAAGIHPSATPRTFAYIILNRVCLFYLMGDFM